MKFLNPFIDKLQATFPPNRICILLAGPIVAASAWLSAIVATNVPGVELPTGIVAGVIGAVVLIVVTLLYKWFDQWQAGEPIHAQRDLEAAFEEIVEGHQAIDLLVGNATGVKEAIAALHDRISRGEINEAEVAHELKAIFAGLDTPGVEVTSPGASADVAPPTPTAAE